MDDVDALRQQLRDEAAWRAFVEDELAREAEKARIWRERAEERAARIDRLVAGRSLRQALAARISGPHVPQLQVPGEDAALEVGAAAVRPAEPTRPPSHPEVRATTLLAGPATSALADEFDRRELAVHGTDAMRDADLVVADHDGWTSTPDARASLLAWLEETARPPLLWIGMVPDEVARALRTSDRVAGADPVGATSLELAPWAAPVPSPRLPRDGSRGRWVDAGGIRLLVANHGPALAVSDGGMPHRALGLALAGTPVVDGDGRGAVDLPHPETPLDLEELGRGMPAPPELRRLAIRQRRAVHDGRTAAARATEVLVALEIPHITHEPRLAVLLSSNRPSLVPDQLAALGRQRRRPDEVRVALHGGADADARAAVAAAADGAEIHLHLSEPAASVPLGSVLNALADATGAELLAKIDDDDHYGPAHLLDAEAALRRTGADLVGNKAHYVHLTGEDRTWLLAEDAEDTWTEQGLMGATFLWRHGLLDAVRFSPRPRRVDSLYVRAVAAAGARMYALPANDFAYVRDPGGRTNVAGASYVRARGRDVGAGLPLDVVDV